MKPQIFHVHFQASFLKQPQIQIQQNLSLRYPHILGSFLLSQPKPHTNKYIFCLSVGVVPNLTGEQLVPTLPWSHSLGFVFTLQSFGSINDTIIMHKERRVDVRTDLEIMQQVTFVLKSECVCDCWKRP